MRSFLCVYLFYYVFTVRQRSATRWCLAENVLQRHPGQEEKRARAAAAHQRLFDGWQDHRVKPGLTEVPAPEGWPTLHAWDTQVRGGETSRNWLSPSRSPCSLPNAVFYRVFASFKV